MKLNKNFLFLAICCFMLFIVSNVEAQTVEYKTTSGSTSSVQISTLGLSSLVNAVEVTLTGDWTAADFYKLKRALKSSWDQWHNGVVNSTLKSVDMSGIVSLSGNFTPTNLFPDGEGFTYLFDSCISLENVVMPNVIPDGPVSFFRTFNNCQSLKSIDISMFTNISAMNGAIRQCYSLTDLMLPTTDNLYSNPSGVSFNATFQSSTRLKTIDLSHFTNISDIGWLVRSCEALEEVIFPTSNAYTGNVTFENAFYGCKNLKTITNIDVFKKVSILTNSFRECSSLIELKLGVNPNSVGSLTTTFHNINPACYKWFVTTPEVTDIPQTWKNYYKASATKNFYSNFVLPLSVANVTAPTLVKVGATHTFSLPAITQPYAERVGEPIWRLIRNPNSASSDTTLIEATAATQSILFDKAGYYNLSCGVVSPNGTTYWSSPAPITVVGVTYGSYSLAVSAPSNSTIEVKDADGANIALSNPIVKESEGVTKYQFTQGVPGATYTVFQDGKQIETATMSPVPTYTAASGSHSSAPSENTVVEVGDKLTLTAETTFNSLLTSVQGNINYKHSYSSLVNSDPITVEDGLLVSVDLTNCNDQWAYMSMPFDFDVKTGIRYQVDEEEIVGESDTHFYLMRYSPASRAVSGEGTGNWVDVSSGIIKAGEGFLLAKEATYAQKYKILALNPNSLDAADKEIAIVYTKEAEGRTCWDANWNFIGSPFTAEYTYRPKGNASKYLYRKNSGSWAGGYEINYDEIEGGETMYPYTPYLTQVWGDHQTMTLKADGSAASLVTAKNKIDRNAFVLQLYKDTKVVDKVGWLFTPNSSRDIVINEDAIKAGLGGNCMWTLFAGYNLVYNSLPFEGDSMIFELRINAEMNTFAYKINMRSATTEDFDVFIREIDENNWHNVNESDYQLRPSASIATRMLEVMIVKTTPEVQIAKSKAVALSQAQDGDSDIIVYSSHGTIFIEGVKNSDIVSVKTISGARVAECRNSTEYTISNLALGSYLIRIKTENGLVTKKVTNAPR